MNREDGIALRGYVHWQMTARERADFNWLLKVARAARKLRDAVIERPDDVVSTSPYSNLANAMGGPFGDLSILLHEES